MTVITLIAISERILTKAWFLHAHARPLRSLRGPRYSRPQFLPNASDLLNNEPHLYRFNSVLIRWFSFSRQKHDNLQVIC